MSEEQELESGFGRPPRRRGCGLLILILLLVAAAAVFFVVRRGYLGYVLNLLARDRHLVTYTLTGPAENLTIHYTVAGGKQEQDTGADLPWTETFTCRTGDYLYLEIADGSASDVVTARIIVDGVVWRDARSMSGFPNVTTSGNCPSKEHLSGRR